MAGLTDGPFRAVALAHGAGYVVSEMVSARAELWHTPKSRLRRTRFASDVLSVQQIAGSDPEELAAAAVRHVEAQADIIDINFGCPAKKVCRKAAGSALLNDPELVVRIVDAVVRAVPVPVTVKMRTGWAPEQKNGVAIARGVEAAGAQAIVVHGRTRACRFNGAAEYRTVRAIKRAVSIPVFANGDIDSVEKARSVLVESLADGVMIGRSAIGAPWLLGVVAGLPEPTAACKWRTIFEHLEAMYGFYGVDQGLRIARKHVSAYLTHLGYGRAEVRSFNQLQSTEEQRRYLGSLQDLPAAEMTGEALSDDKQP